MNKVRKFLLYILLLWGFGIWSFSYAQNQDTDILNLKIIPTVQDKNNLDMSIIDQKWEAWNDSIGFWYKYEKNTNLMQKKWDLWWQIQWWFINISTILSFLAYLIRLISNIAIVAWAFFVIRWWYEYALQTFGGKAKTTEYIKNVFIGIFIMSFAYGIIKILAFTFLE